MLKDRILSTLKFFDLQDTPLTLVELHKFLLADWESLKLILDTRWELIDVPGPAKSAPVAMEEILRVLDRDCQGQVVCGKGFYVLSGRTQLIDQRLKNYFYGIKREKLIKRYISGIRHIPFVRAVGLVGSQALGLQKPSSDIDLLIIVAPEFLWLTRMLVTGYFQILGLRRHGQKVANRFCLNHYVIEGKALSFDRNLYTAAEYIKMRPLVYQDRLAKFSRLNADWIIRIFPNAGFLRLEEKTNKDFPQSQIQNFLENLLISKFGRWLEQTIRQPQYNRINLGEFIVASDDELSFHPDNRKQQLFREFFNR